jgi:uncharacterized membrane protein YbhN (UPF0104 family)
VAATLPCMNAIPLPRLSRRQLIVALVAAALAAGSIVVAAPELGGVAERIATMNAAWIAFAVLLELASCLSFVALFRRYFGDLAGGLARRLAWTGLASNALLPGGGVCGLAVPAYMLHVRGVPTAKLMRRSARLFGLATAVTVAVLMAGGLVCLAGCGPRDFVRAGVPVIAAAVIALAAWCKFGGASAERGAATAAAGFLLFDIAALGAALAAAGDPLPVGALVLGYLVGYVASIVPIPGGIGVVDAGLAGALTAYGARPSQAAAAVLVYHAIAFWLPSLGGAVAFVSLRANRDAAAV